MIAAYLIDSSQKLSMDSLSKSYLNYEPIPIEKLIGKKRSTPSPPTMPTRPPASSMHQDRKLMMVSIIGPTPFSLAGRGQVALVRQLEDGDDRNEIDQRIDQGHVQQVAVAGDKDNQGYGQHGFGAKQDRKSVV